MVWGESTGSLKLLLPEFRHLNFGCEQIRAYNESRFESVLDPFEIGGADLYGLISYHYSRLGQ